jgi:hypothetical protein
MNSGGLRSGHQRGQLLRYGLLGLATNIAGFLVYLLVTHLGAPPAATMSFFYVIGAIAAILIVAGYLFLAFKFFVFANPERE